MKRAIGVALLAVVSVLFAGGALPDSPRLLQPQARKASLFLPGEEFFLKRSLSLAKPLDLTNYAQLVKPPIVDYSNLLTYVRCQDHGGGCMIYAALAAADIINEFQAPYAPDLSWQYALRTWDETFAHMIDQNPNTDAPDLDAVFNVGVASEGLCRSESDYLTKVPITDPKYQPKKGDRMWFDPAPSAEAKEEAQHYKFEVSDPITPSVETLKTLLVTHGPVWASGGWWFDGGHAMCVVGYNEGAQTFKIANSQGDWWGNEHGFLSMPYDKVTTWVRALRTLKVIPTQRYQGRWAYSSRIRIRGTWRGTWTVNIGVQGQVPETVYRTYGRMTDRPYCYGERLDLDVPLPSYAGQFWPPKHAAKWYLQVEDNDHDGQTGQVLEWILARRYEDPSCGSVDHWKTQTFKHSKAESVPDATGTPESNPKPSKSGVPATKSTPSGKLMMYLPEGSPSTTVTTGAFLTAVIPPKIQFIESQCDLDDPSDATFVGTLTVPATGAAMANKSVELCLLSPSANQNKPHYWKRIALTKTDSTGRFQFTVKLPSRMAQYLGAAYRLRPGDPALCSTSKIICGEIVK